MKKTKPPKIYHILIIELIATCLMSNIDIKHKWL